MFVCITNLHIVYVRYLLQICKKMYFSYSLGVTMYDQSLCYDIFVNIYIIKNQGPKMHVPYENPQFLTNLAHIYFG